MLAKQYIWENCQHIAFENMTVCKKMYRKKDWQGLQDFAAKQRKPDYWETQTPNYDNINDYLRNFNFNNKNRKNGK